MISVIAYIVVSLAFLTWVIVGVWRSAGYHEERGGAQIWAVLARVVCAFGALAGAGNLLNSATALKEVSSLAIGYDTLGEDATFEVVGDTLYLEGHLTMGSADRFADALEAAPGVTRLSLSSAGGRLLESKKMAELVTARGLTTMTSGECSSACTTVFLAGRERLVGAEILIGFHQGDFPGMAPEDREEMLEMQRADLAAQGLSSKFIDHAMSTPPDDMWYPSNNELISEGIITGYDPDAIEESTRLAAAKIREMVPYALDDVTTIVDVSYEGNRLITHHTVDSYAGGTFAQRSQLLRDGIVSSICGNPETRFFIEAGGVYVYRYETIYEPGQPWAEVIVDSCS